LGYTKTDIMKNLKNLLNKIETLTVEELKKIVIALQNDTTNEAMLVSDKAENLLIEKMESGEFEIFINELW
jgi:hypothetical protein